jgi:phosphoserine phosphatase
MARQGSIVAFAAFVAAWTVGCAASRGARDERASAGRGAEPSPTGAAGRWLPAAGWHSGNHAEIERWLDTVAAREWSAPPVAVLDWDNTCVFNDVGEATLFYQLDRLAVRFDPEGLAAFLPAEVGGRTDLGGGVSLADVRADLLEAWAELWPHVAAGDVDAARALPAHEDFRAKALWLYHALEAGEGLGPTVAYPWLAGWLAGHDTAAAAALVRAAIDEARRQPVGRTVWRSATAGRVGNVEVARATGLCPHDEMRDLATALERAGVDVYIVSASAEVIVEAAAAALGFPVGPDRVFGVRVDADAGVLTARAPALADYPLTWRQGKVEVIRRFIGRDPIFAAGDADTDYEMLTAFPVELRLVVNRNKVDDDIGRLYREALAPSVEGTPRTLLQGRDEARCVFHPLRETTRLGEGRPTPLPAVE